jgi:predicted DNA-binding transcriptional regulator YafY
LAAFFSRYDDIVGQRSRTETVAAVLAALLAHRNWSQADLAREVGVRTEALRQLLEELQASGVPLVSEKDHPHVYWSVPKTWFPGGVIFRQEDVPELVRQLRRLPRSKARERLLAVVDQQLPTRASNAATILSRAATDQEEQYVPVVEDAAAKRTVLWMRYFTASRGKISERHASVHLVDIGPPARFVATCHRSGDLRWFRVDGITRANLDANEKFREAPSKAVAVFRAQSLDGFKGDGPTATRSFFVREPECRWVANNLLEGMRAETLSDGIRVHAETSAVIRLARFVVGLGDAARAEDPALAEAVAELARGALDSMKAATESTESAAVSDSRAHDPVRPPSGV